MSIALLIAGDFRTFPICRKTMLFLDQQDLDIDVYFSTWDITKTDSGFIEVTEDIVRNILSIPATIKISKLSNYRFSSNNEALVTHWKWGIDMIKSSGKDYDYVCILRPDLFFEIGTFLDEVNLKQFSLSLGSYPPAQDNGSLSDLVWFSSFKNIDKIVNSIHFDDMKKYDDWHMFLYNLVFEKFKFKPSTIPISGKVSVGRIGINENSNYDEVCEIYLNSLKQSSVRKKLPFGFIAVVID